MVGNTKDVIRPTSFLARQFSPAVAQSVGKHRAPPGDVVEGNAHRVLNEARDT